MPINDRRNRAQLPFIPNSPIIFNLNPGLYMRKGNIILKGTIIVSGGTAAGTPLGEGGPTNLIKRIYVTATPAPGSPWPGGRIVDCSPRSLLWAAATEHNGKLVKEQSGSTLGNGANGTYTFYLSIPIYFEKGANRNPMATALNMTSAYSNVQVEIDTGDLTSCFQGNNAAVNWTGLVVQWVDDRVSLNQPTYVLYKEDHIALIGATQTRMIDAALPQNGSYLEWLILQEQSAAYTLADTLLNRVTVSSPSWQLDQYLADIKQDMLDNEWFDPAQSLAGIAFLDFTDGLTANAIPANTLIAQFDVNNVSGANLDDLRIYTERIFQPASS